MQIFIVVPTYNEIDNVRILIEKIVDELPLASIVVVDDNSPDGTGYAVEEMKHRYQGRLNCIRRTSRKGLGPSCIEGFKFAIEKGADKVVQMDADGSHSTDSLKRIIEASERCDMVIGSRYVTGGSTPDWPMRRRLLSLSANLYARTVLGLPVKDVTSGYKCYNRKVLEEIDLNTVCCLGYGFQVEIVYRIFRSGFSIVESPITFNDRTLGESKMGLSIAGEGFKQVLKLRFGSKGKN